MTTPQDRTGPHHPVTRGSTMVRVRHVLVPAIALAAIPVTSFVLADRLPSPIARHWGAGGVADGSGGLWAATLLVTGIAAVVAVGSLVAVRSASDTGTARGLVATAHAIAVGIASLHATTLAVQMGLDDWRAAELPFSSVVLALLVPGLVAGVVGWLLAADLHVDRERTALPVEEVEVEAGEAVLWSGRSEATWQPIAASVLVVLAVLVHMGTSGATWAAPVLVVAALLVLVSGRATVTVGPAGARVRGGVVPFWPRVDVPLEEVTDVRVEVVDVLTYGGLGYRVRPGVRAVVTWPGEAVRIDQRDGASLVVTLPGARTAAGVLQAHVRASGAATG